MTVFSKKSLLAALAGVALSTPAIAQEKVVNVYSGRHYQTDEALYAGFTKATGIKVNRIEAGEDAIIERIRNEGARSPADVMITVDAGRLWRAEQLGLFQPVKSATLDARIPASLREPGGQWFGFSTRARVIAYNKAKVQPGEIKTYEELADPKWKGRVCMRSSTHVYNLAQEPKGGDTDQLKAVAAGQCDVTVSNQYYYARLARSDKADEKQAAAQLGIVLPNQESCGTHVNISGAGVLKNAPHRDNAVK